MAGYDWTLRHPGGSLVFGSFESGLSLVTPPEVGTVSLATDDAGRPRGDGIAFGQDFEREATVSLQVRAEGTSLETGRALEERFAAAWRNEDARLTPGAFCELEAFTGRVAFGRPRRYLADRRQLLRSGIVPIIAEFDMASPLWYGPEESIAVQYVPAAGGGFVFPITFPVSTTAESDRSVTADVGGSMRTWPVVIVRGPITNPTVQIGASIKFELRTSLTAGQSVVIDTRPWARTVKRNGANAAGLLSPYSTRLAAASVAPGSHEVVLRGTSPEGTASAEVRWRDAFPTY